MNEQSGEVELRERVQNLPLFTGEMGEQHVARPIDLMPKGRHGA